MLSTGSEQQGLNIRVRPVFLTLTKILDLLVFFNQVCKNVFLQSCNQLYPVNNVITSLIIVSRGGNGGSEGGASGGGVYIETNVAHVGGKFNS